MTAKSMWTLSSSFSGGVSDICVEVPTRKRGQGLTVHRRVMMMRKRSFTPPIELHTRFHGGGEVSVRPSACIRSRCEPPPPAYGRVRAASVSLKRMEAVHEVV